MNRAIKNIDSIIIKQEYADDFINNYSRIDNKENKLKTIFIQILKDNYDETVIKLIDLKNKFFSMLSDELKSNERLIQILKNLIGSNKDNKTSLVRDPNVDWYYCYNKKKKYIEVDETNRKPILLPKKLERSRSKRFFVFYTSIIDDSLAITSVVAEKENAIDTDESYNSIDFDSIAKRKIDYVDKQSRSQKIGDIGEDYIFNKEKEKLKQLDINLQPIWVSRKNDSFGFDILSYRKTNEGQVYRIFIEVKTTTGNLHNQFYVSDLEMEVSHKNSDQFILMRVFNASDENEINYKEYYGDISTNSLLQSVNSSTTSIFKVK